MAEHLLSWPLSTYFSNKQEVSSAGLRKDFVILLDFIERLKNRRDQIALDMDQIEKLTTGLTFMSSFFQLCYFIRSGFNAEISCILYEVHDLVQSLFHQNGDDMLLKLKDHVAPRLMENIKSCVRVKMTYSYNHSESSTTMTEDQLVEFLDALLVNLHYLCKCCAELIFPLLTQYELLQNICCSLRDFHGLKVNGCIEHEIVEYVLPQFQLMAERVGHFYDSDEILLEVKSMLAHLLVKIIPVKLEVLHICSTSLKASKSADVGCFIKQLLEASPDILREHLIHLQEHMVNVITVSLARDIHLMIEFLLIILADVPKDVIHHDKLFVLLACVGALTREVFILVCNLEQKSRSEEKTSEINFATLDLLKNIGLLKEDLKHVYLKAPNSKFCFLMNDGPFFMTLLLRNLKDLLKSNANSVAFIKEEIRLVKEDLEFIRSFFGNVEQELNRDLWTRVVDVAYEAEHAIKSILVRDHGLLQLIFLLPDTIEKIKLLKDEVPEKISKNRGLIVANSPNEPVESKSSTKLIRKIIVGFEEVTNLIIKQSLVDQQS
ncbi:hypothetical protein K7X08_030325 [Anisodus acutangulus]|uniref:Uncharacterized protein n=1 Tax=Anisodus acutangulus TaxID=402998 RepID=A0A9Q1LR33_9SOLA|nr:hypothetical protein K7X08_030325 [Anisodus acutangulus]